MENTVQLKNSTKELDTRALSDTSSYLNPLTLFVNLIQPHYSNWNAHLVE